MPAAGIKRMKRMSGEAKPRKRPPSRYYLSNQPMEARHQRIPVQQVAHVNVVFARGQWCWATLVSSWKTGRSCSVTSGVETSGLASSTIKYYRATNVSTPLLYLFFFFQIKFYTNVKQFFYYCIINTTLGIWYFIFYLYFLRYKVTIFVKRRRVW